MGEQSAKKKNRPRARRGGPRATQAPSTAATSSKKVKKKQSKKKQSKKKVSKAKKGSQAKSGRQKKSAERTTNRARSSRQKKSPKPNELDYLLSTFARFTENYAATREIRELIAPVVKEEVERLTEKLKKNIDALKGRSVSESEIVDLSREIIKVGRLPIGDLLMNENNLISLIARLEELVARVATALYTCRPESMSSGNRTLSYTELLSFSTMEEAVQGLLERELFRLSHDSNVEQISALDEKLKCGLHDTFDQWDLLEEVCARRNLYIHSGGIVNAAYLRSAAKALKSQGKVPHKGDYLPLSEAYLSGAHICLLNVGIQLCLGAARRLHPNSLETIDAYLLNFGYLFLKDEEWALAESIFKYALRLSEKWTSSESVRKKFFVNHCISLKHLGRQQEVIAALRDLDWTSTSRVFLLARAVLLDDYESAATIMKASTDDDVGEDEFRAWPLFLEFRKTKEFADAFQERFGKAYVPEIAREDVGHTPDVRAGRVVH